ncbi:MAG: hypothetical protein HYV35_10935 [Lentisphaerae bacterium]|nr:hypothetical protein [Lentisphaerota bacterium]
MSLIQDALKRQQQEAEGGGPKAAASAPPDESAPAIVPESMPAPARPEPQATEAAVFEPEIHRKSGKQIALIILSCLLIVWGSFFLAGLYLKMYLKSLAQLPLPGLFQPSLQQSSPLGESFQLPAELPEPVITPAADSAPAIAGEDETKPDAQELPVATLPAPGVWPRLKLSAVFSDLGSGQAGARLNNRLVLLGGKIDGVTLVEIRSDGVMLKSGSAVRFLKMGATLH